MACVHLTEARSLMGSAAVQTESYFLARGRAQYDFRCDLKPGHSVFLSGWSGGKSFTGADKHIGRAIVNQGNGILGAQHYRHLAHVMVPKLMERAAAARLGPRWLKSEKVLLYLDLPRDNQFGCQFSYGLSADAPESIRAIEGTFAWLDEPAAFSRSDDDATRDAFLQFQGRVRGHDVAPGIDYTGTNEGDQTRFFDLQSDRDRIERGEVRVYRGSTLDNIEHVGDGFIRNIETSIPRELIDQYLHGGVGQLAAEMAAWSWTDDYIEPCSADPAWPLVSCWDFGIAPFAMSVAQRIGDADDAMMRWLGEVVMPVRGNTADACVRFCEEWRGKHPGPVIIKGDATGGSGSAASRHANYEQIIEILGRYWSPELIWPMVPKGNPPVMTRLVRANHALARGLVRVDPSCRNLLRDLRGCRLRQLSSGPAEDQKDGYSHSWVGMAYALHDYYPVVAKPTPPAGGARGQMVSHQRGTPTDPRSTVAGRLGR